MPIIINMEDGKYKTLYHNGSIMSGWLQTNFAGGIVNAIVNTYARIKLYPDFTRIIAKYKANKIP
jgi:hypothetical protein